MEDRRVLVIDHDPDQGRIVQRSLDRHGFTVTVVSDGTAALDALAHRAFALMLLDFTRPGMNGLEVLAAARARGVRTPVVVVTAQGDERLAVEAMEAGGMDFVVKTSGYLTALPTVLMKVLKQHELLAENERLHRLTERRLRDGDALVELAGRLTSTLELKSLLETIGQAAARACDMERCAIFAYEGEQVRLLAAQFADGRRDDRLFDEFAGAEGRAIRDLPVIAAAIRGREAVVINDDALLADDRGPVAPRCLLALPLFSQDVVKGALLLERQLGDEPVSTSQIVLGTAIASHVGLALENARLYEQAQQALTDLKETRELVRGETLRALGELAGGAAHHLNNLLAVISGRAQLMLRTGSLGALQRHAEVIDRMTTDAAEVVRRIQTFAGAPRVVEAEPVNLNQLVTEVVETTSGQWRDAALAQGLAIRVECELAPAAMTFGPPAALREVVTNLILNAVDALPRGGRVRITTASEAGHVFLSVSDDGTGMTPDVLRRAQEPFFTTKGVKSTGLGLSVNYGIVRRHGGDITITSAEGEGTTVLIRLPSSAAEARATTERAVKPLRILLVDDEREVREALAELLDFAGHTVVQAQDGAAAVARLEAGPVPDVVLTDHGMPGMTGRELTGIVSRRWPGVPVGLLTGWGYEPEGAAEARPDFVLAKPIQIEHLLEAIGRAFSRRVRS